MKERLNTDDQIWLENTCRRLKEKMEVQTKRVKDTIPYSPVNGRYTDLMMPGGISFWTNGFYTGILWQMYEATGNDMYKQYAQSTEDRLAENLEKFETTDHDIGFLFLPSSAANWRKTGNEISRSRALKAAQILAGRYNPNGCFIRAWNDSPFEEAFKQMCKATTSIKGWMIIDCIMNIPLLYWASEETGDPRFADIAKNHARTAQKYVIRADGSCNHIVSLDPVTGEFLEAPAGQGYDFNSSWSRGQSWAVYGFALSYRHTGEKEFLETAKRAAHYCIANLAVSDWLPLVDYRQPEEPVKYDSTAGVITACGLLEIAEHVDEAEKNLYIRAAVNILKACEAKFANWNPEEDSILGGGTFFYHDADGSSSDMPIIYGDYYFIEALNRLQDQYLMIW